MVSHRRRLRFAAGVLGILGGVRLRKREVDGNRQWGLAGIRRYANDIASCPAVCMSSFLEAFLSHAPSYSYLLLLTYLYRSMFGRLNQVVRQLSRPAPNFAHRSAASFRPSITSSVMASAQQKSLIHTAGCLIIGDEVLGGKVGSP
jgi:hypothetical protein